MNAIQTVILEIYKEIRKVCEKNNISYYALGGTCIGAVRHNGFIPWDDDLDLAIPIEQFEKFIECAKEGLPKHLKVVEPKDSKHNDMFFIKVININTTMIESRFIPYSDMYGGVWVDIFPLAGIPEPGVRRKCFYKKGIMLEYINKKTSRDFATIRTKRGKLLSLILTPLKALPAGFWWDVWFKELKKHPLNKSLYTGHVWEEKMVRLTFPSSDFQDYIELKFEDTTMRCPVGYDQYLTQFFGNYMELPPKNKRNSGHEFTKGIIDLSTPYSKYIVKE